MHFFKFFPNFEQFSAVTQYHQVVLQLLFISAFPVQKAHVATVIKFSPDWPEAFGAFKSFDNSPGEGEEGSCSLIGRIVCVAVVVTDAGSAQQSGRD